MVKLKNEFFAVLEATDAENLLDQFEDVTEDFDCVEGGDTDPLETNNHAEEESKITNPKKTSNIFKAVQNHFAASAASTSTGGGSSGSRDNPTRKLPRIGKHESKFKITCRLFCWSTHGIFVMHADWMGITCRKWNVE